MKISTKGKYLKKKMSHRIINFFSVFKLYIGFRYCDKKSWDIRIVKLHRGNEENLSVEKFSNFQIIK